MQTITRLTLFQTRLMKNFFLAIIVLIALAAGLFWYSARQTPAVLTPTAQISQSVLSEKYGLRVSLLAVTAAGGMVDVRLKVLDGEKAKLLLLDKQNFPVLTAGANGARLNASDDSKAQEIKLDSDNNLFFIYPNAGNLVRTGTPVTILFGNTALEAIAAK